MFRKFAFIVSLQEIARLAQISRFSSTIRVLLVALLLLPAITNVVFSQDALKGMTPSGLAPGAPAGSYSLSGFETVNPYNGGLNFNLPLVSVSGRGGVGTSAGLTIEQKWSVEKDVSEDGQSATYWANYNKWVFSPFYVGATIAGRKGGTATQLCHMGGGTPETDPRYYIETLTRFTVTMADGTEFELRDKLTGGEPKVAPRNQNLCPTGNVARGKVFITADGTAATFVSDADIYDDYDPNNADIELRPSGYLMLRDGTKYRFDNGYLSWMRDRNGNKLTFAYTFNQQMLTVTTVTDSLNRQVTIERDVTDQTYGLCDRITYKGFGGATRTLYVTKTSLSNVLRTGYSLQTYNQLFPTLYGSSYTYFNPTVANAVKLPNGKQYQFSYNSYGELARVVLPTGGAIEYDWQAGDSATVSAGGMIENQTVTPYDYGVYRRVAERRVYADGSTLEHKMIYPRATETDSNTQSNVAVETRDASGALLGKTMHYYYGSARQSFLQQATNYSKWREGKEKKTEAYNFDGATVLRTTEQTWAQRATISWWTGTADDSPPLDPRLTETVSTLKDVSPNKVSKQTFAYDQYNNQTDIYEYHYGDGAAGGLIRRTHTDYVTTGSNGDYASATPTASSVHIRNLPWQTWVSTDAAGNDKKSHTTLNYDYYVSDGNHAALVNRTGISGHDSSFTTSYLTRGNVTSTTRWMIVNGNYVATYQQYDIAGNLVKVKDGRSYETEAEYSDRFGSPSGEARANSAPSELSSQGQSSYAFVTKVTSALNQTVSQTVYSQFDFYTGMAVDGEDQNGIVASGYSTNDSLDRPTRIIRGVGTPQQNQTTFLYDDTNRVVTTTSDFGSYNDNQLKSESRYDGLGRTFETRSYETSSAYIKQTQTFDALGRVKRAYNPHRTTSDSTYGWGESTYDALGRVTNVTTSDNAVVTTAYSGNSVTVTDQASKVRRSISDALGRLEKLDEPDANGNLGTIGSPSQRTEYTYDVLNNLTQVQQGSQTRTFAYDALSRLSSAANPESGTVYYGYDANGNLTSKYNARAITTTIAYDALNRPTSKTYNDSPQTAGVYYYYDSQTLPSGAPSFTRGYSQGRLVAVTYGTSSSNGTYRAYDALGRVSQQFQQTDNVNYQVDASYNLASAMTSQTYPGTGGNRRSVSYSFDTAGRLSSLTSNATSYSAAASVSSISYSAHGALSSQTLGNITSTDYYGGGVYYSQSFTYDSLNRLSTAQENSGTNWTQTNGYDRYGNRTVTAGLGQSLSFYSNNRIIGLSYDAAGNLTNDFVHRNKRCFGGALDAIEPLGGAIRRYKGFPGGLIPKFRAPMSLSNQLLNQFQILNFSLPKTALKFNLRIARLAFRQVPQ